MNFTSIFKQSVVALRANKLRSIFSILGIVIGVSAVVIILSLGEGLKGLVTGEVEAFGSNVLDIAVKIPGAGQVGSLISMAEGIKVTTLKVRDVRALQDKEAFPYIEKVTGQAFSQDWASYGGNEKKVLIYGSSPDFIEIFKTIKIKEGRIFNQDEDNSLAKVVILGSNLRDKLFGQEEALGKKIKLKGLNFKVVGTMEPYGGISFGGVDMNDMAYLPLQTTLKEVLGIDYLSEIALSIKDESYTARAIADISRMLRKNHNIADPDKDDFFVETQAEAMETVSTITNVLTLFLAAVAAISLVVGAVGIMNSMFTSVLERTRDIGVMKAIGSRNSSILLLFLIESGAIGMIGGILGVLIGLGLAFGIGFIAAATGVPLLLIKVNVGLVLFGLVFALLVGMGSGLLPAIRASRLQPVDAPRYE